jgi:hypothetical protein
MVPTRALTVVTIAALRPVRNSTCGSQSLVSLRSVVTRVEDPVAAAIVRRVTEAARITLPASEVVDERRAVEDIRPPVEVVADGRAVAVAGAVPAVVADTPVDVASFGNFVVEE